ncbi:MAG: ATPase, T2SS/T4P/T4SS family, partial [Verrucomicrobia bacterium]|nr:ATPase, T2SS/T4P/T4SS family [Verrucomicrobiota bacterium]
MAEYQIQPLLALIKERGLIDDLQYEEVMQEQARSGKSISQILNDFELLDLDAQLQIMADSLGTEVVSLRDREIGPDLIKLIPANSARLFKCVPVEASGSLLKVAFADPLNPSAIDELGFVVHREIQVVVADPEQVQRAVARFYGEESGSVADMLQELGDDSEIIKEAAEAAQTDDVSELADLANETPIIKFVNLVLGQAIQDRASDIHFEPFEDEFKIRYRVDGALYEMAPPPKHLALPVISRLKVMSNLNISERRLPQDGRINYQVGGHQVDLRVSTLPTQFRESVVLRVLDRSSTSLDITALGLPKHSNDYVRAGIQQPNGVLIVTGPTG